MHTKSNAALRVLAIVTVTWIALVGFGVSPVAARAGHEVNPDDMVILAPLAPDSAIWGPAVLTYVYPSSQVHIGFPQRGPWSLDWAGGGGLAAGHYEGMVTCYASVVSIQEDPILVTLMGHCVVISPGVGVIVQNPITVTSNQFCPTSTGDTPFRMEWSMHIAATGAYSALSGDGVAVIKGTC